MANVGDFKIEFVVALPGTTSATFITPVPGQALCWDNSGVPIMSAMAPAAATAMNAAISSAVSGKEPAISMGTTSQYFRGDKTWQTFPAIGSGTVTSIGVTSSNLTISGSPVTSSGNIAVSLPSVGTAGTYGVVTTDAQGRATSGKRQETYSVTTNASGVASVTFGTAYSAAPNIQAQPTNFSSDNQFVRVTSITTTGFSVICRLRTDIAGLLPSFSNINGATVDVLITEK